MNCVVQYSLQQLLQFVLEITFGIGTAKNQSRIQLYTSRRHNNWKAKKSKIQNRNYGIDITEKSIVMWYNCVANCIYMNQSTTLLRINSVPRIDEIDQGNN